MDGPGRFHLVESGGDVAEALERGSAFARGSGAGCPGLMTPGADGLTSLECGLRDSRGTAEGALPRCVY